MGHNYELIQKEIDSKNGRLSTVLYVDTLPRLGTFLALANAITDGGHLALMVSPSDIDTNVYQLAEEEIRSLRGVDLFFSSEMVCDVAPPQAVTIGIIHSIPDAALKSHGFSADYSTFIRRYPTIIRTFDYLVIALRQDERLWRQERYKFIQNVYPGAMMAGRRPALDIVPGGYPKIDYSELCLSSNTPRDHIIYSPTSWSGSSVSRVKRDGEEIVAALLESFPHFTIVFRPYPGLNDRAFGASLADRFAGHNRFILDDSETGIDYQQRCAIAVTDSSSSAITFSLSSGRPLVMVDLNRSEESTPPLQNPLGYNVQSIPSLLEAIRAGIDGQKAWYERIMSERSRHLYNPGRASVYLSEHLWVFVQRESMPNWLSIERRPWQGFKDESETKAHLKRLRAWGERAGKHAQKLAAEIEGFLAGE